MGRTNLESGSRILYFASCVSPRLAVKTEGNCSQLMKKVRTLEWIEMVALCVGDTYIDTKKRSFEPVYESMMPNERNNHSPIETKIILCIRMSNIRPLILIKSAPLMHTTPSAGEPKNSIPTKTPNFKCHPYYHGVGYTSRDAVQQTTKDCSDPFNNLRLTYLAQDAHIP